MPTQPSWPARNELDAAMNEEEKTKGDLAKKTQEKKTKNKALKKKEVLSQLPDSFNDQFRKTTTLKGHIKPLLKFRRRWEEIKGAICQSKDNLGLSQQDFLAVGECFALREADLRLETVKSTPRLAHKGGVYSTDATISQNYSAKAIQLNSAFQSLRFEEKYVAPKE